MDLAVIGGLLALLLIGLMLSGMYLAYAIGLAGVIALLSFGGFKYLGSIEIILWSSNTSWVMTTIPLFLLMGEILVFSGIGSDFFGFLAKWLNRLPGGLAVASVLACAGFAAISGSGTATAATIGTVAIPELEKRKYNRPLVYGAIASAGTLGILIPPSVAMIVYSAMTETSVAKLFMAGVVPGFMIAAVFSAYIILAVWMKPDLAPPVEAVAWKDRLSALKEVVPVGILIALIMGGIYSGIATATEAAAIGVVGSLGIAAAKRRMDLRKLHAAALAAVRVTVMIMLIVTGTLIYSQALTYYRIPQELVTFMSTLPFSPIAMMFIIYIVYTIAGCIMEAFSLMIISLPIVFPLVSSLGFDPVWFGIVMIIVIELGMITPPFGMNLFVVHGLVPERPMSEVIRGALPFVILMWLFLPLITFFPSIVLWLPSLMK